MTWLFSDNSKIHGDSCGLDKAGGCKGELSALWWFRQIDRNQFINASPNSFIDLHSGRFGYEKSMRKNKIILCDNHSMQTWGEIAPYVNMGLDHFEMGIQLNED